MQPVWNEPALHLPITVDGEPRSYLVASELHLGLEHDLAKGGVFLLSRSLQLADRLRAIAASVGADRLILLGDVKHKVTHLTPQEKRDLPAFFRSLASFTSIDIAVGNHDTGLERLLPRTVAPNVRFHPADGFLLKGDDQKVASLHGHAWPRPALLAADTFLVGHTHAAMALADEHGRATTEWAWIRGRLDPEPVRAKYGRSTKARVIVFPPFNPLCGGTPVNRDGILGPFKHILDPASLEVHLLDGRSLGRLDLPPPRKRPGRPT